MTAVKTRSVVEELAGRIEVVKVEVRDRTFAERRWTNFRTKAARVYPSPERETTLEQFTEGRHTRPHGAVRIAAAEQVEAAIRAHRPLVVGDGITWKWSTRAGCTSCPCSPGFVLNGENTEDLVVYVVYRVRPVEDAPQS